MPTGQWCWGGRNSWQLLHHAAVSTASLQTALPPTLCAARGAGGSVFWESCTSEATAPPRTIGKITEGSLKRLGRGMQRNASFAQAERLLRAKSREKSAVAQLHLFVSSLCSPRLDYPDVDLHAAQIFTVSQRGAWQSRILLHPMCVWQSGSILALERPRLMDLVTEVMVQIVCSQPCSDQRESAGREPKRARYTSVLHTPDILVFCTL